MKNILITGSNGQLGTELQGLSYTHAYNGFKFYHTDLETLDITSKEQVNRFFENNPVDCLINCAAYTGVDKAESESDKARMVNTLAAEYLARACDVHNASMIHVSTDYVFDGSTAVPYREDDIARPLSVYGTTKLEGEKAVLKLERGTVIRSSWLYSHYGKNFFNTVLRLASEKDHISMVYDQVGTPTYARDLARVLLFIANSAVSGTNSVPGGLYHFSNEGVCSWYDFAAEIVKMKGLHCRITPIETELYPLPAKRPNFSVLNKTKIRSFLTFDIPHWRDSLSSCIDQLD